MQLYRLSLLFALPLPLLAADTPKFETASVRRAEQCSMQNSVDPGRVALIGDPLRALIMEAFDVKLDQVIGPPWLDAECYTVIARLPEGATKDRLPEMFQALLVERFKLAAHKENRVRPGYLLVVDKGGPKFKQSAPSFGPAGRPNQVRFGAAPGASGIKGSITMAMLAHFLTDHLGGPVEDRTSLDGKYDIDVTWTPDPAFEKPGAFAQDAARRSGSEDTAASLPSGTGNIFAALRDTLGLRLEPRKEQVEVVIVDHIERVPVEN